MWHEASDKYPVYACVPRDPAANRQNFRSCVVKVAPVTPRTIREVQLALELSHSCPNHFSKIVAVYSNTIPYPPRAPEQPKPGRPPKHRPQPSAFSPLMSCLFVVMDKPVARLQEVVAGGKGGRLDESYAKWAPGHIIDASCP